MKNFPLHENLFMKYSKLILYCWVISGLGMLIFSAGGQTIFMQLKEFRQFALS